MKIGRVYYPVTTLGYGKRVGIWVTGCNRNCRNCMSKSLKDKDAGVSVPVDKLLEYIGKAAGELDGVTISGGEPFLQIDELSELVEKITAAYTEDIIVFTGYTLEELERLHGEKLGKITKNVAAIIDGEYVDELNHGVGLRGSSNQRIHVFKHRDRHGKLEEEKRRVQIVEHDRGITVIGIP